MTAGWLLPVVTLIVASSTGGVIAPALAEFSAYHTLITLTVSAIMVSIGLCLALMILTMYFLRLILYGVPESTSVVSVFIPLGPTGQAGYSILLIGQGFRRILPLAHHEGSTFLSGQQTGDTIHVMCTCVAFVLWALSTMWLLYAILAVQEVLRATGPFPFKITVWGLIFPNVRLPLPSSSLSLTNIIASACYQTYQSSSPTNSTSPHFEYGARYTPLSPSCYGFSSLRRVSSSCAVVGYSSRLLSKSMTTSGCVKSK